MGTPCISTDVTGIPEVLIDGETGLHVPQKDIPALATACERLIDNPELGIHLARNARGLIEEKFDITANAASIRQLIGSVLNNDPGARDQGNTNAKNRGH